MAANSSYLLTGLLYTENGQMWVAHSKYYRLKRRDNLPIRPKTPRLNGKVERSHRVDEQEFYQLLDKDGIAEDIHLFNDKLQEWEDYYSYHRPHRALDGQTPYERLLARKASASVSPNTYAQISASNLRTSC
jgi:transposase InsO family protein